MRVQVEVVCSPHPPDEIESALWLNSVLLAGSVLRRFLFIPVG